MSASAALVIGGISLTFNALTLWFVISAARSDRERARLIRETMDLTHAARMEAIRRGAS